MPIWLRQFTFNRAKERINKQNEEIDAQNKLISKSNKTDISSGLISVPDYTIPRTTKK